MATTCDLSSSTFSLPTAPSGSSPDLTASFFLPLFSVPKLHRTTALLLMPFNKHANPSVWSVLFHSQRNLPPQVLPEHLALSNLGSRNLPLPSPLQAQYTLSLLPHEALKTHLKPQSI